MGISRNAKLCAAVIVLAALGYHSAARWGRARRRAVPTSLALPLDRLPLQLNGWSGKDVALSDDIIANAGADSHLRRDYTDDVGQRVSLYVAFYANVHDNVPHGPVICYPSGGWATQVDEAITLPTKWPGTEQLKVRKLLYEKDFSQVAVLYWYAANGEQLAGEQWLRHDSARRRLLGLGGAYVIQVMVSAPVVLSQERAFAALDRFLVRNFDVLAKHFPQSPQEIERGGNGPTQ